MAEPAVMLRDLRVLRGERAVLSDVRLDAHDGEVLCVLGPNGAGKSTLVRAVAGLLPFAGTVHIRGSSIAALPVRDRARVLAFVPQRSELTAPLLVQEVVKQGRFAHESDPRHAVRRAMEMTEVVELATRPFTQLSEGERRRVLLARALATEATVLLLDEPTAALDVRHGLELLGLLRQLAAEKYCIVVVLHALDEARRVADRVVLLQEGRVAFDGPPAVVIAPDPVRQVYGVELVEGGAVGARLLP